MLLNTNLETRFQTQGEKYKFDRGFVFIDCLRSIQELILLPLKTLTHCVWLSELLFQDQPFQTSELDTRSYLLRRDIFLGVALLFFLLMFEKTTSISVVRIKKKAF